MGSQGRPAPRRGRAGPPISSSPWPLQREGKHPLSCTSYSLPPAGRPRLMPSRRPTWTGQLGPGRHACVCLLITLTRLVTVFDKAFLRMAPQEGSLHRRQAGTPTERDRVGVTGLPRKIEDTSVPGIRPRLQRLPHCSLELCLVAGLSQRALRTEEQACERGCLVAVQVASGTATGDLPPAVPWRPFLYVSSGPDSLVFQ